MNDDEIKKAQGMRLTAARMAAGFKSGRAAAQQCGWPISSYSAHEAGRRTIGLDDAKRYAKTFAANGAVVTAEKILFGSEREREAFRPIAVSDTEAAPGDRAPSKPLPLSPTSTAIERKTRFVRAIYGGKVEAGSFRSVDEFDDEAHTRAPIYEMVDDEFPDATAVTFDVVGDSMNALKPLPIIEGQRVVCLEFESLKNRAPIRDGMVVVVEQTTNGGHLRERSVKQVQLYRDRAEFCPRSTNSKHKPIVVTHDRAPNDGREVAILAVVRRITSDVVI